jgi:polysaccharide pyruvyl transferase CsaB
VRVAIFGYYGFGNLGDEAVLGAMLQHLHEALPSAETWVVSADPGWTEKIHGVRAVRRTDLAAVRRLFRSADLVCSGGGSLFQDVTSWRSPLFYGLLHELARTKPLVVYAQGVGPLRRRASRAVTRRAMEQAARITVRDPDSAALLRQLGVRKPAEVVCDPALAFRPRGSFGTREALTVSVRPWARVRWEVLRDALRQAARTTGTPVRVLCLHRAVDFQLSRALAEALGAELLAPSTPQEALRAVAEARVVVGMRLHALVLAAAAGVPFVGLAYDPKVSSFAGGLDQPWVPVEQVGGPELTRMVVSLWEDGQAAKLLQDKVAALQPLARRPAQVAADLLDHPGAPPPGGS